ncbi:MAG: hypothetical protein JWQ49_5464 [Edaphobacter sp.]|nr:hypothetical protein [Edaphobacter sp.]
MDKFEYAGIFGIAWGTSLYPFKWVGFGFERDASQIRLTDSSYLTSALTDSDWAVRLRQDIDAAQAVFFVGYSTYDIDIARLLNSKPAIREKSFFVVGSSPTAILKRRIEKFGFNTEMTAEAFFSEITKDEYAPKIKTSLPEICIRTYQPIPARIPFADRDVFDLFMIGRLSEGFVFDSVSGKIKYVLQRKALARVLNLLEASPAAVAIHSSLGNGKTVFLDMVKAIAATSGFTVVELVKQRDGLFEELNEVLKRDGKLLLVIDNYGDWQEAIRFIGMHHKKNISILLAARASTNDVLATRIQGFLNLGELNEVSLDKLIDSDLLEIVRFMDTYGFWGDKASWSEDRKLRHLSNNCGREWHAILIELFKAPQIRDRLDSLIHAIQAETNFNTILIAILVLAIIDHPATSDILTDLCGESTLTIGFRQNAVIRELIDFESDEVKLRSAVTGAFILKRVADPELVLESLKRITKAADQASLVSREYFAILAAFTRFGNVQNFFPEEDGISYVIRYYEAMKELRQCRRYPLFWLQYAIACLFHHDFARAGTYFASAYSFAKRNNFRTFQIDNHYARYLLLKSIHDGNALTAMDAFRNAQKLIVEQMKNERLHYPYRTALLVGDWFDAFGDQLTAEQLQEVKRAASFIAARISELPELNQQHRDVVECYRRMRLIIDKM